MPGLRRLRLWAAPSSLLLALFFVPGRASAPAVPYTLAISPLAFLPAAGAGIDDERGCFREILCAGDEANGHQAVYPIGAVSWCAVARHPHFTPTVVSAWSHSGLRSLA
jgi:hypothetical protein